MNQPPQSSWTPNAQASVPPVEITAISGADTTAQLSRALAIARWRSPSTWAILFAIPLIVLSRSFIQVFIATSSSTRNFAGLLISYVVILAIAAGLGLLFTVIQVLKRNKETAAYTLPGTSISVRYQQDSLELILATGTVVVPYDQIRDLFAIGESVFLRIKGERGRAFPGVLFPVSVLELVSRKSGRRFGDSGDARKWKHRKGIAVVSIAVLIVIAAVATTAIVVGQRKTERTASSLPALRASLPVPGAERIALNSGTAYVASSDGTVSVIDVSAMTVKSVIHVGADPRAVVLDPRTQNLYVASSEMQGNSWISVIDTKTNAVKVTIQLPSAFIADLAIDPAVGNVYATVARHDHTTVLSTVRTDSNTVGADVPIASASYQVAVNTATHIVYVASDSPASLTAFDGVSGQAKATIPVGGYVRGLAVDSETNTVYTVGDPSGGPGDPRVLKIIDTAANVIRQTLPLSVVAEAVAIDPASRSLFVLEQDTGAVDWKEQVRVLSTETDAVIALVTIGSGTIRTIAVDPSVHSAFAVDSSRVSIITR
ncbi:YncE family protein [Nocardia sp. NPDC006630]|uniref:YncE family protein n=1 Tax=Nocardia sp. NPDC006630 TaxID=3157181 RepID=UPI0033AA2C2D